MSINCELLSREWKPGILDLVAAHDRILYDTEEIRLVKINTIDLYSQSVIGCDE